MRLVLASASPRRRELLSRVGLTFQTVSPAVDESRIDGEPVKHLQLRLAEAKARAGLAMIGHDDAGHDEARPGPLQKNVAMIAADTVVSLGELELGKPRDRAHARWLLATLSNREHTVTTAVYVLGPDGVGRSCSIDTKVTFPLLDDAKLDWLASSGEGDDKAGGYAVQGLAGAFITRLEGSYTNVVGLPLSETLGLLAQTGFELPWSAKK
jgi:septum formation protein